MPPSRLIKLIHSCPEANHSMLHHHEQQDLLVVTPRLFRVMKWANHRWPSPTRLRRVPARKDIWRKDNDSGVGRHCYPEPSFPQSARDKSGDKNLHPKASARKRCENIGPKCRACQKHQRPYPKAHCLLPHLERAFGNTNFAKKPHFTIKRLAGCTCGRARPASSGPESTWQLPFW